MYEELVKELRSGYCEAKLLRKAADALESRDKAAEEWETLAESWKKACKGLESRMPRWIPVTEGFPKDRVPVQVCYIGMNTGTVESDLLACRYYGAWCYWDGEPCSYDECKVEITHWMPLTRPPKEEA